MLQINDIITPEPQTVKEWLDNYLEQLDLLEKHRGPIQLPDVKFYTQYMYDMSKDPIQKSIHISDARPLAKALGETIKITIRNTSEYPVQCSFIYNGIQIYSIHEEEEM